MTSTSPGAIDPTVPPSGTGCAECLAVDDGWWFHLRRCAQCGHIGCCDTSPGQHATRHFEETGHSVMRSFEPGENWFWDFRREAALLGPELTPPTSRPDDQEPPAPSERVPDDWEDKLN
ncbi:UBP-type zinc finger domain-containing protein [Nocardioides bigeumensis]|uniref:UBP-type zinc finger domain-containing protein n=1 Tax=Nocardioides bigeumensis TaxID=433657 RepID=A0ABN2YTB7_9ACTN